MRKITVATLLVVWLIAAVVAGILQSFHAKDEWAVGIAASLGTIGSLISLVIDHGIGSETSRTGKSIPIKQLPPITPNFIGRRLQQRVLRKALRRARHSDTARIATVAGRAGVGKTTLAIKVAHDLARRFPDGQFYIDLRGAHKQSPLDPAQVLATFLTELGVDPTNVPPDVANRSRLFRQRVAGLKMLFVYDNAANSEQIRDLLPGDPSCAVVVTSRIRLTALDSIQRIDLHELGEFDARKLLATTIGKHRVGRERESADSIIRSCNGLPLAIRIVGARLAAQPSWPLARIADGLTDEKQILDELKFGDLALRASLNLSYQAQSAQHQAAFRKLTLIDATDFSAWPLAAVFECSIGEAERILDELSENCLIEALGQDRSGQLRYRLHDLVREFSQECLDAHESTQVQIDALTRIGLAACAFVTKAESDLMPATPTAGKAMAVPMTAITEWPRGLLADPDNWMANEKSYLQQVLWAAYQAHLWDITWELSEKFVAFLDLHAMWDEWQEMHDLALEAATLSQSKLGEATILRNLAILHRLRGKSKESEIEANQAIQAYIEVSNLCGQADCEANLAWIYRRRGQIEMARKGLLSAIVMFQENISPRGEAWGLYMLADLEIENAADTALAYAQKSVAIFEKANDRRGRGWALRLVGDINRENGMQSDAISAYISAQGLLAEVGDRRGFARAAGGLAGVHYRSGNLAEAAEVYEECSTLFRELGDHRWEMRVIKELQKIYMELGKRRKARLAKSRELAIMHEINQLTLEPAVRL